MTTGSRRLLGNHGVKLAGQVATERLRRAGVTLGEDLGLPTPRAAKKDRSPLRREIPREGHGGGRHHRGHRRPSIVDAQLAAPETVKPRAIKMVGIVLTISRFGRYSTYQ